MTHEIVDFNSKAFEEIEEFILSKKGKGLRQHLKHHINQFIRKNQKFTKRVNEVYEEQEGDIKFLKNKDVRGVIKLLEKELHTTYSQFLSTNKSKRENGLENSESILELLQFHKSTQERIESFNNVYSQILNYYKQYVSDDISKVSILDIACGMNPLSIEELEKVTENSHISWIGSDVNENDMQYLEKAYSKFKKSGEFLALDITLEESVKQLEEKEIDILFAFKALDSFEYFKRNISFDIIERLNFKMGVISFATYSLGGRKKIPITKRTWILRFLERNQMNYTLYETDNEVYIMFKKN